MPATAVSGLDLYVKTENGRWRWLSVGRPTKYPANSGELVKDLPAGKREYLLYLPLYNGVRSVELGLPKDSTLAKAGPWSSGISKPIVFYGTSITQGGCASRPGMVHTAILGRQLNCPVINLGFSGNGKMEPEMARPAGGARSSAVLARLPAQHDGGRGDGKSGTLCPNSAQGPSQNAHPAR